MRYTVTERGSHKLSLGGGRFDSNEELAAALKANSLSINGVKPVENEISKPSAFNGGPSGP